jgi:hypothetical protein
MDQNVEFKQQVKLAYDRNFIMKKKRLYLSLLFFVVLGFSNNPLKIYICFCDLPFDDSLKKVNVSFTFSAYFSLNKKGVPYNIKVLRSNYKIINPLEVKKCVTRWKIQGFPLETKVFVSWHWRHAIGWMPLKIFAPGFEQEISIGNMKK